MTSRTKAVLILIAGCVALAAGASFWLVPDEMGWRIVGVVLVSLSTPLFITGGRLMRRPDASRASDYDKTV